jgi:hypothetical protein
MFGGRPNHAMKPHEWGTRPSENKALWVHHVLWVRGFVGDTAREIEENCDEMEA